MEPTPWWHYGCSFVGALVITAACCLLLFIFV
jgi:hypothetical protein